MRITKSLLLTRPGISGRIEDHLLRFHGLVRLADTLFEASPSWLKRALLALLAAAGLWSTSHPWLALTAVLLLLLLVLAACFAILRKPPPAPNARRSPRATRSRRSRTPARRKPAPAVARRTSRPKQPPPAGARPARRKV